MQRELPGSVVLEAAWGDRLLGGWVINGIYTYQVGAPLSWGNAIYYGGDLHLNPHLSVIKNTHLTGRVNFQLRFESFNAFNRPEFSGPNLTPTSSASGPITSQPNLARSIQLAGRVVW